MSDFKKPVTRSSRSALSLVASNDLPSMAVEESASEVWKTHNTPKRATSHAEHDRTKTRSASIKPGKWRKSIALWRASANHQSLAPVGGGRRITMDLVDKQQRQPLDQTIQNMTVHGVTLDVSMPHFSTPLVSRRTSAERLYMCPKSPKDEVLHRCGQKEPITFERMLKNLQVVVERKLGEGVYGEVYLCTKANNERSVLKLIPVEGNYLINAEKQKTFEDILSEIIITTELSSLREPNVQFSTDGFIELRNIFCVKGSYPQRLIDLWLDYDKKKGSENDNPLEFSSDQHYIVFETAFGGTDLDGYRFKNALQAFSVFAQVILALAIAEKRFDFEHRDLHTGNVLIEATKDTERKYYLLGEEIIIQTHGLKATIIDYTLSRIVYNGLCLFNDLCTEEDLFTAEGDYQFEIYRLMRSAVENQWNLHSPKTNIYWLHYLLDKLNCTRNFKQKSPKATIKLMSELQGVLLKFSSVHEIVQEYFKSPLGDDNKEN